MNAGCIDCAVLRMGAVPRGRGYEARFICRPLKKVFTHLMAGGRLPCHSEEMSQPPANPEKAGELVEVAHEH